MYIQSTVSLHTTVLVPQFNVYRINRFLRFLSLEDGFIAGADYQNTLNIVGAVVAD